MTTEDETTVTIERRHNLFVVSHWLSMEYFSRENLFQQHLNVSTHEIHILVSRLEIHSSRLETIKALRRLLKASSGHVPHVVQSELFSRLNQILLEDQRENVLGESLWLVVDVIPQLGPQLDSQLATITPIAVTCLGHESQDVKRASLRLLHVFMRHTLNLQKALKTFIQFGLESRDSHVQRGAVVSVPLLFGEEFSRENLHSLVTCLGRLLVTADSTLFYAAFLALQRLNAIVGDHVFDDYLDDREARDLYHSVLSRDASPQETHSLLEKPEKPLRVSHVTFKQDSEESNEEYLGLTRFGIFPSGLIGSALSGQPEERLLAIESVVQIIRETPRERLMDLIPFLDSFLVDFVSGHLLEVNSFKVTLLSLDLIEVLVDRLKPCLETHINTIVTILAKRLGDGRTVVRDSVIKVIHALMYSFPPQQMLDILLQQKPSKNPKIREEVVNRVTAAVLTFPRSEFNLAKLCWSVCPLLCDNRRSVRLASLECLSVLAQALGPNRLQPLLAAVEAVQSACAVDGLQNAVQSRLARRALPRVATDGTVRYVLNPQHFSGWFSSTNDADLEWVMMATPSSTGGTPPKRNNGVSGIPLANIPYDVRRKSHVSMAPPPMDEEEAVVEEMVRRKSIAETDIGKLLVSGQTQERPLLDEFRGQSFNSEDDRRDSTDSRGSGLEVWRQYFSRFRKQLAEVAFCQDLDQEFIGPQTDPQERRASHVEVTQAYVSAQDMSEYPFRGQSPQHSSSAPSTASAHENHFFQMSSSQEQVTVDHFEQPMERSMSLPSITQQTDQILVEEATDQPNLDVPQGLTPVAEEKPSPMLGTPLPPQEFNEPNEEVNDRQESEAPPFVSIQEATPQHSVRRSSSERQISRNSEKLDVWTQKDETQSSETEETDKKGLKKASNESRTPQMRRKRAQPLGRQSRSQSPQGRRRPSRAPQQIYIKTTPAIPVNANIRHILVNVAKTEGPFDNPQEAVKAAIMALHDDAWTTKVEGMLAVTRLATFHAHHLARDQHQIVTQLIHEVKNLRSTVSRSAIFTLGELFARLRSQVEPEMDSMVSCLLAKSGENVVFIREDIERALMLCLEEMPQTRTALALIHAGANHRNSFVRKTCSQFLSLLVQRMGPIKCLLGPRDIAEHLLPAAARFVQDQSPHTRYFGRKIFAVLQSHVSFDKLLRKHVTPGTYRNICGILESIKRRGIGDRPQDLSSPLKGTPTEG